MQLSFKTAVGTSFAAGQKRCHVFGSDQGLNFQRHILSLSMPAPQKQRMRSLRATSSPAVQARHALGLSQNILDSLRSCAAPRAQTHSTSPQKRTITSFVTSFWPLTAAAIVRATTNGHSFPSPHCGLATTAARTALPAPSSQIQNTTQTNNSLGHQLLRITQPPHPARWRLRYGKLKSNTTQLLVYSLPLFNKTSS